MNHTSHAFLALLSHAANVGFRTNLFDPGAPNGHPLEARSSVMFDAPIESVPVRAWISDWRYDEARIVAAAWPTAEVDRWIAVGGANALAGEVVASGWLERGTQLRLVNIFEPSVFIQTNRLAAMRGLAAPSEAADPLRLYPPYLSYDAAA
jgi:hypothetical protein